MRYERTRTAFESCGNECSRSHMTVHHIAAISHPIILSLSCFCLLLVWLTSNTLVLTLRSVSVHRAYYPPWSLSKTHVRKCVPNITLQHTSSSVHSPECRDWPTSLLNQNKCNTVVTWIVAILAPHLLSLSLCCTSYYLYAIISMEVSCGDAPDATTENLLCKGVIQ